MQARAREIFLLAAEDAFEFERWREAGPLSADVDGELKAAEVAEFEALGIPMPDELDSLRRELEHAPKVREAIRGAAQALRRSGRGDASALVALGPQGLVAAGVDPRLLDPRLLASALLDRRLAEQRGPAASGRVASGPVPPAAAPRSEHKLAGAAAFDGEDPVDAELVDLRAGRTARDAGSVDDWDLDEDDDDLQAFGRAGKPRAARPRAREWDEDDSDDSLIAAPGVSSERRTTWLLGGIAVAAIATLAFVAFDSRDRQGGAEPSEVAQAAPEQPVAPGAPAAPMQPVAPVAPLAPRAAVRPPVAARRVRPLRSPRASILSPVLAGCLVARPPPSRAHRWRQALGPRAQLRHQAARQHRSPRRPFQARQRQPPRRVPPSRLQLPRQPLSPARRQQHPRPLGHRSLQPQRVPQGQRQGPPPELRQELLPRHRHRLSPSSPRAR